MCKITCLTSHNPTDRDAIILAAWREMSGTEKDGFGAAWFTPKGEIGHYRSSLPALPTNALPSFVAGFGSASHASARSDGGFLIIHGRTSTCGVSLENTHPMLSPSAALVHNGVVSSKTHHNQASTCDSELLLSAFTQGGIAEVAKSISGYYAFMLLQRVHKARSLTIVRDHTAQLHAGKTENGFAFATTPRLLAVVKAENLGSVKNGQCISFRSARAFTVTPFTPLRETETETVTELDGMADVAFGRSLATPPASPRRFSNFRDFENSLR